MCGLVRFFSLCYALITDESAYTVIIKASITTSCMIPVYRFWLHKTAKTHKRV